MTLRTVFFGTPEFALPSLRALAESPDVDLLAAVTQPDKPAGRGNKLQASPVKLAAGDLGIEVLQPASLRYAAFHEDGGREPVVLLGKSVTDHQSRLLELFRGLDLAVVVAYGKIIPEPFLSAPRLGMLNVHPSLLPRWRGAAPIQRTVFAGDSGTGVAIMRLTEGLDSGPVFDVETIDVGPDETAGSLHDRLAPIGARMLSTLIPQIAAGLTPREQMEEGLTYAEKWTTADLTVRWDEEVEVTLRRLRACLPHPGVRSQLGDELVKVFAARAVRPAERFQPAAPGTIVAVTGTELIVAAGSSHIALAEIQFPGKKKLTVAEMLKGRTIRAGERFVDPGVSDE